MMPMHSAVTMEGLRRPALGASIKHACNVVCGVSTYANPVPVGTESNTSKMLARLR